MNIDKHGLIINAKFDDNPILHTAYLTHNGNEVFIHDYAQLEQLSSTEEAEFIKHLNRFTDASYFTLRLKEEPTSVAEKMTY